MKSIVEFVYWISPGIELECLDNPGNFQGLIQECKYEYKQVDQSVKSSPDKSLQHRGLRGTRIGLRLPYNSV